MNQIYFLFIMLILCVSTWGQNTLGGVEVGILYLYDVETYAQVTPCDTTAYTLEVYINDKKLDEWPCPCKRDPCSIQTSTGAIYQAIILHSPNLPQEIMIPHEIMIAKKPDNTPVIMLKDITQTFSINFIIRETACYNSNHTHLSPQPVGVIWHKINLENMQAGQEKPPHPAGLESLQKNTWKTKCATLENNSEYYDSVRKSYRNKVTPRSIQHLTVHIRWFLKKADRVPQTPVLTLEQNLREQIQFFQRSNDNLIDAKTLLSPILQKAKLPDSLYDQAIADLAQGQGINLSQMAPLQESTYNSFTIHKAENFDVYKNNQWIISAPQIKLSDNVSTQDKWELREYNSNTLYTPQYIAAPILQSLATRNIWLVKYKEERNKREPEKILLACYDIQNLSIKAQSYFDAQAQNYSQAQTSLNNEVSLSTLYPQTSSSPSLKINFSSLKLKPDDLKKLVKNDIAYYLCIPNSFYYKIEPNIAISLDKPLELPIPEGDTASLIQSGKLQWYISVLPSSPIAPLIYTQQAQPNTPNYGYLTLRPKEDVIFVVETRDKIKHNVTLDSLFQKIKSPDDFEFPNDPAQTLWMITWPTDPLPDGATENDYYNRLLQSVFYKERTTVQYGFATPFDEIPKLEGKYDANTASYSNITLTLFAKPEADLRASFVLQYPGKEVYEPATDWIIQDMPQENSDNKAMDKTGAHQQATLDSNGKMDLQTLYRYIQTKKSLVLIPPNDKKQYEKINFNIALKDITPIAGQYNYELRGKVRYAPPSNSSTPTLPSNSSIPTLPSNSPSTSSRVIHWVLVRETCEEKDLIYWATLQVAMTKELCALGKNKLAQKENVHLKIYVFYFSSVTHTWELHLCSEITSWDGDQDILTKEVFAKLKQIVTEISMLPVGIKTLQNPIPNIPDKVNQTISSDKVNQTIAQQKNVQQRLGIWLHNSKNSIPLNKVPLTSGAFLQAIIFSSLYNDTETNKTKQEWIREFFSQLLNDK